MNGLSYRPDPIASRVADWLVFQLQKRTSHPVCAKCRRRSPTCMACQDCRRPLCVTCLMRDWRGVVALAREALALARELRGADPGLAGKIHGILGLGFRNVGEYARAREMHEQHRAICEALGDRAGVARACGNLGNCYDSTGDYGRARELHVQHRAICEALGDRAGGGDGVRQPRTMLLEHGGLWAGDLVLHGAV